MPRPRVFVTRRLPGEALSRLDAVSELHIWRHPAPPTPAQLRQECAEAEGLLCLLTDTIDARLIDSAPKLRVISSVSVGLDHVELAPLQARGIPLGHTPHVLTDATADLTMGLMLAACRRIPEAADMIRQGGWTHERRWEPDMLLGRELGDSTLGIIGLGPIGQAVARRAAGFGTRIIGWTPSGRSVTGVASHSFDSVIEQADILSLHLALTPETRHLIDRHTISRMRPGTILVNTARGPLVDQSALLEALDSGHLGTAALDVFEHEPLSADHPFATHPRVLATPHIGSATIRTRIRMAELAVDNLIAGLNGEPMPYCANRPALQ